MENLLTEINNARLLVHTDSYPMSIGELVNLYEDGELEIHPEFQRVFRWTPTQKSSLIESILLGIPLPSIFVAQNIDGVWDVVDGLQRISTILSFMGKLRKDKLEPLKDDESPFEEPFELQETKYLKGLKGKKWDNSADKVNEIDVEIKRLFKREKIDIKIIKRESQADTRFELFQRLNTGGSKLSEQEVRNCMLLMINKKAFNFLEECSNNQFFIGSTPLTERKEAVSYRNELALRFFVLRNTSLDKLNTHTDVHPFLDSELARLFDPKYRFDFESEMLIFEKTFEAINAALGEDAFRKYNSLKVKYEGALSLPVFEAISFGVSNIIDRYSENDLINLIQNKSQELSDNLIFISNLRPGTRPIERTKNMLELGRELFQ